MKDFLAFHFQNHFQKVEDNWLLAIFINKKFQYIGYEYLGMNLKFFLGVKQNPVWAKGLRLSRKHKLLSQSLRKYAAKQLLLPKAKFGRLLSG